MSIIMAAAVKHPVCIILFILMCKHVCMCVCAHAWPDALVQAGLHHRQGGNIISCTLRGADDDDDTAAAVMCAAADCSYSYCFIMQQQQQSSRGWRRPCSNRRKRRRWSRRKTLHGFLEEEWLRGEKNNTRLTIIINLGTPITQRVCI